MSELRLFDLVYRQLELFPNPNMFTTKTNGQWVGTSTQEFVNKAMLISRGLISLGINAGDKVGVVSSNRVEWNMMDIAIQQIGAIMVPIYPNISENDYRYIFNNAGIKIAAVGTEELYNKIQNVKADVSSLQGVYTFDRVAGAPHLDDIIAKADGATEEQVKERSAAVKYEDLVTIIYTSGTTGNPKGVMLSHKNIMSNVMGSVPRITADEYSRCLTFLPACHVYERMLHYLYMYFGAAIYYAESMDTIGENIKEVKPHFFTAVPRLLEKVFDKIIAKGEELEGIKRKLFFWAVEVAEEYELSGKSIFYKMKLGIARKLIFSKWQEALGGEVKIIASGSAALQPRLARIFLAAGINVLEGYGLTETSPVISVNCLQRGICIGSVGTVLEHVEVKIAEDGEILTRSASVMMGYYNNPEATAEVLDADGWFHTGDIGEFVHGKFLKITDRKKEIFKTSGGKYIVPQMIENTLKESRFIEQVMVIGEGEKFPSALIVPAFAFLKDWAERKGLNLRDLSNAEIVANEEVKARIMQAVTEINKRFGNWEQIKKIELLANELSIENGELTPTLKLKRKVILAKNQDKYDKIYKA